MIPKYGLGGAKGREGMMTRMKHEFLRIILTVRPLAPGCMSPRLMKYVDGFSARVDVCTEINAGISMKDKQKYVFELKKMSLVDDCHSSIYQIQ
mmetsp:Transcript_10863/g.17635  ORF Transcript_10863/g.17635 Transcript_10863/m.17635 type:complete len:94 (-) Transcript_10863:13-294(-)